MNCENIFGIIFFLNFMNDMKSFNITYSQSYSIGDLIEKFLLNIKLTVKK